MALYLPYSHEQSIHFPFIENTARVCRVQSLIKQRDAPIYICWSFPPQGYIKINTDGSFMPNSGLAGFGGIARDDKRRWIGGFYGRLSMKATSSITAELWAIHGGLTLAKNYNLKKVLIETDSSDALMLLTVADNVTKSHPDRVLMKECRSLISKLGITLIHTLRQGNNCADHLAKLGRTQKEDLVILHRPPHSMQLLLLADMAHVAYARYPKHVKPRTKLL
ncbi:putative ribonuclease h protein [Nicotiana attenuata]|uniref:Ribonuclease h protein n=1 Tax=Nicotiana attenuata TaxID=49451 RepID=A0A1J6IW71_NICAT|nr:putative ribonuclease h protein [Nicotiana attenuata]